MTVMSPRTYPKGHSVCRSINSMNRTSMQAYLQKIVKYMDIGYKPTGLYKTLDDGI